MDTVPACLLLGAGLFLIMTRLCHILRRPAGFPPGPLAVPLLGSLPFMGLLSREASPNFFESLSRLAEKHGPVYSWAFGHRWIVVISDYTLIREAMVQRRTDFAGRQAWHILRYENPYYPLHGLIDDDYSSQWKLQMQTTLNVLRRLGFGKGPTESIMSEEAEVMNDNLRTSSTSAINLHHHIQNVVSNVITSLLFGQRFDSEHQEWKTLRKAVSDKFAAMELVFQHEPIPGAFLLPSYRKNTKLLADAGGRLIGYIKQKIAEVPAKTNTHEANNFVEGYREERRKNPQIENRLFQILSDLIQAGLETTSTTLIWAVYFMIAYPDVQRKVHEELDLVVGRGNSPKLEDKAKMPYVEATLMEALRLGKTAASTVPHVTLRNTSVGGFNIPERTEVWILLWHLYKNPKLWPEPDVFKPERFLDPGGSVVQPEANIPFGIGRRACMGEQLAKQQLFIQFTHLLHAFHIRIADGEKLPDPVGRMCLTHQPPEFKVNVTSRE